LHSFFWGNKSWSLSGFASNNTCFNGISNHIFNSFSWWKFGDFFDSHIIISSSYNSNFLGSGFSNFFDCFNLSSVRFGS
jgi:hypothetical protein